MPVLARKSKFANDDQRWRALVARDPRADGAFVYSVKTTGVYCRPACASRLPRRENVRFHADADAAERAGFRACKRCRPRDASADQRRAALVAAACRRIAASEAALSLTSLAAAAGMSPARFHRAFKELTGVTPKQYANALRTQRLQSQLAGGAAVARAIVNSGFNSHGRFYAATPRALGMTPTAYRRGGAGTVIQFAVGQCSLGAVLVAASPVGVCSIALGDDPDALVRELQNRFPRAELVGGDDAFERRVARVIALIERPAAGLRLPLDVQGTAFQQRVWKLLSEIPSGTTVTYAELARRAGAPRAVRAVAQACAANRLAVAIPCHRVVRTDGALAGYRWGVDRKRALLERERSGG